MRNYRQCLAHDFLILTEQSLNYTPEHFQESPGHESVKLSSY